MKQIPQMEPWFGDEEKRALAEYMDEGGWITEFKRTGLFESMIAGYTRSAESIVVNNGTISLTLAAMALGIGPGDEVIVPNYTMIATPNSISMLGARPVFVDVEAKTLCLDIAKTESALTKSTKAIMLVSANGRFPAAGIAAFEQLCAKRHIAFIEDSAQSLGSWYPDGRHIGTAGSIGSFSFSAPKVISTGQGGALVTNDPDLAKKLRRLKDFGRAEGATDLHDTIGFNAKFTELQACVGIEQMKKLPWRVERKKEILKVYRKLLAPVSPISFFEQDLTSTTPWFIDVLAENRNELMLFLRTNGIGSRVMYPPINRQKCYQVPGSFPVSELVGEKGLWLPSSSRLTDDEIAFVCDAVCRFYRKNP